MLKADHLTFSYRKHRPPVLEDISFQIEKGELCALFGPNGTGKTTLFRCCMKFLTPSSGTVSINGTDIRELTTKEMARKVAYVPQANHCAFPFTVGQMVLMGRTPHLQPLFSPNRQDREITAQVMDNMGIRHLAQNPFNQLSGGQKQMVLIARAIAQQTRLIFLDEPSAALDFQNQITLWQTLQKIADQGTAILACTHDPNHAAWFCHTSLVFGRSGLIGKGPCDQMLCQPIMDRIYQNTCQVKAVDGLKIMVPRKVTSKKNKCRGIS